MSHRCHTNPLSSVLCGLVLVTQAAGCAPSVALFRGGAPAGPARAPSAVQVYMDEKDAPRGYSEIGLLVVNTHVFIPVMFDLDTAIAMAAQTIRAKNSRDTRVFRTLLRRAARLGADGVIIKGFSRAGTHLSISAVAVRYCQPRPACIAACRPACPPGTVPVPSSPAGPPPNPVDEPEPETEGP